MKVLRVEKNSWSEGIVVVLPRGILLAAVFYKRKEMIKLRQLFQKSLRGLDITGKTANSIRNYDEQAYTS